MPRLILRCDDRVVKEYVIETGATIGRLPDNTVVIDNPAVSSHHARIFRDGDFFVVEDLQSKNGTYVNDKFVMTRRTLKDGDVVLVGKHKLTFEEAILVDHAEPVLATAVSTMYLDTQDQRELLARLREARQGKKPAAAAPSIDARPAPAAAKPKPGVLRVKAGRADRSEYALEAHTSLIGASREALVRLQGWFKPQVAVAIARDSDGYVATSLGGQTQINNQPLVGRQSLRDGDVLNVNGLVLEFRLS